MEYPEDLLYSEDHLWVLVEGDSATIGLSEHIQAMLDEVVSVDLAEEGDQLDLGSPMASVESSDDLLEVYSPLSGEIIEVNEGLADSPEWVHVSPYEDGWLLRVKITAPEELDDLLNAKEYREFIEEE
ncbi:MAG: glycine cleavage system protein GcvH [Syntrophotaleaceae bacterium]